MRFRDAPTSTLLIILTGVPAIVLAFALLPDNPYSYFLFVRAVVCIAVVCEAVVAYRLGSVRLSWLLVAIAVLYSPFLPVHLSRLVWLPIHLLTIIALGASGWSLLRLPGGTASDGKTKRHRLI